MIFCVAKPEDGEKYETQKGQTQAEAGAFAEIPRYVDWHNDADNEINHWNNIQNDPPERPIRDLQHDNHIVDA